MNELSTDIKADYSLRARIAGIVILALILLLVVSLWRIQLIQGSEYIDQAHSNRTRFIRLPAARGKIVDIQGRDLARNTPSFVFSVIPGKLHNSSEIVRKLSAPLGTTEEKLRTVLDKAASGPKFMSHVIKRNLSLEEVSLIKSKLVETPGASLEVKPVRTYPEKETLCHIIGSLGEISADELTKGAAQGYHIGDLIGKSGLEREYEAYLRGEDGWEQLEIDAKGRQLRSPAGKSPKQGADLVLTVDAKFQKFCEDIFYQSAGSIVALEPDTGRILAMVSKPGFDLNLFSSGISERNWKELNTDALHPLENRAIRGLYSPASTFKLVPAFAALQDKIVGPQWKVTCKGELDLSGQIFRCWNQYGHGAVGMRRAIVESCDTYFYELGLKLGPDRISKYAALFGFGIPTGISPQELPGLLPTPAWKARTYGDIWKDGETVTLSIGQGYLTATPLQIAVMTAALANGGKVLRPAIVRRTVARDGNILFEHEPVVRWTIPMGSGVLAELERAMADVVSDKRGTGKKARIPGINVHAKTGTSQVIRAKKRTKDDDQIPYHERTHAIFIAYVNDMPKKIAVAVVVEHGGGGGLNAAPLARKVIAEYYGMPDPGESPQP